MTCNDSNAEVGSSLSNSIKLICSENGTFIPGSDNQELVPCQVPETCPDTIIPDPTEESGLVFLNLTWPIIAYRYATYVCNDSSLITDEGKDYQIQCLQDGTFASSNLSQLVC